MFLCKRGLVIENKSLTFLKDLFNFSNYLPVNVVALFIGKPAPTTAETHYNNTNKHADTNKEPTNHMTLSSQVSSNYFWLQWVFEVLWVETVLKLIITERNAFHLSVQESMYIKTLKPKLCKQQLVYNSRLYKLL